MRLIFGALHLDGARASDRLLRAMAEQLDVPRLRPTWRTWLCGPIGLGVLDFSGGGTAATELPHTAASTLAADVRLDEADSLRRALGADAPQTEDALLLATLEKFGPARLDRVLGDFAFAHWNAEAQRLTCGRDAVGIRPLAYVHQPGRLFAFGSFPIALHGSGIVAKQIDEGALARRVIHSYRFDDSLVMGIKRLPPAHVIEVSNSGVALKRYWRLDRTAVGTRRCPPTRPRWYYARRSTKPSDVAWPEPVRPART